jgi:hypothetical protein
MAAKTIEEYVAALPARQAEIIVTMHGLILETAPEARVSIKWAQPVYESNGPMIWLKAHSKHVNFGFWRGADLEDPRLEGDGDRMRHIKLTSADDICPDAFRSLVRRAVELNAEKGDPTKRTA